MRLTSQQINCIKATVEATIGINAKVWLFGSRVDDQKRGGDVDLYIETTAPVDLKDEMRCKVRLKDELDLGVDLLLSQYHTQTPIGQIARATGIAL